VQREQRPDALALEPHLGVVAYLDRSLAQDESQARYDEHDHRNHRRHQKLLVRAAQVEPDDGQLGYVGGVEAPEPGASVVVGTVLAEPSDEHLALAAERVHTALQVDVQMTVLGDEQLVFAWRHRVTVHDWPVALRVQVGQMREVGEIGQHVLPQ